MQGKPITLEGTEDAFGRGHFFSRMLKVPMGRHQVGRLTGWNRTCMTTPCVGMIRTTQPTPG
jgi:hypothetical protein